MPQIASRIQRFTLDATRTVTAGSIRVHSIFVANATSSPAEVVFTDTAGTPILNIVCPANDSEQFTAVWIADSGLKILGLANVNIIVTIVHSQDGV